MDLGLSFDQCVSITGAGLTTTNTDLANVCANPTVDDGAGGTDDSDPNYGRRVVFDFGTLSNPTGSAINFVITYDVFVLNVAGNVDGTSLDNSAEFVWDNGKVGPFGTTIEEFLNAKVIAMTGATGDQNFLNVAKLFGARRVTKKPFSVDAIRRLVRYTLDH